MSSNMSSYNKLMSRLDGTKFEVRDEEKNFLKSEHSSYRRLMTRLDNPQQNQALSQKEKITQEYLDKKAVEHGFKNSDENVGFFEAMKPGGATPSDWNKSRKRKKLLEKESQEAAAKVAAYDQFLRDQDFQKKTASMSSADIDKLLSDYDRQIKEIQNEGGFFNAVAPGGIKPSEYSANRDKINALEAEQGRYRAIRDEKKSREMTEGLPQDVVKLLDEWNNLEYEEEGIDWAGVASAFTGSGSGGNAVQRSSSDMRREQIKKQLTEKGYDNFIELAEYRRYITDKDAAAEQENRWSEVAEKHPVMASVGARLTGVPAAVSGMYGTIKQYENTADFVGGTPYSAYYTPTRARQAIDETISENFEDGDILSAKAKSFLYGAGTSAVDSAMASLSSGSLGLGKLTAGEFMLGLGAANDTLVRASEKGMTQEHAMKTAAVAMASEIMFEHLTLGKISVFESATEQGIKTALKNIAKESFVNMTEEMATEISNITFDYFYNGGLSDYYKTYEAYINQGMSEETAKRAAAGDMAMQVVEAGASGALIGGVFSGAQSVGNKRAYDSAMLEEGRRIAEGGHVENELAATSELGTGENKAIEKFAREVEAYQSKKAQNADYKGTRKELRSIGRLSEGLDTVAYDKINDISTKAIEERLSVLGEKGDVKGIAKIVQKVAHNIGATDTDSMSKLSRKEMQTLNSSSSAQRVLSEITGSKYFKQDGWSTARAEAIDKVIKSRNTPDIEAYRGGNTSEKGAETAASTEKDETPYGFENYEKQVKEKVINEGQDKAEFDKQFELFETYGETGRDFEEVKKTAPVTKNFTESQMKTAFDLGKEKAEAQKMTVLKGIQKVEGDEVYVTDTQDNVRKLSEVNTDKTTRSLFTHAAAYDTETANIFVRGFNPSASVSSYKTAFKAFYSAGAASADITFSQAMKKYGELTKYMADKDVAKKAFDLGRAERTKADASVKQKKQTGAHPAKGTYQSKTVSVGAEAIDEFYTAITKKTGIDIDRVHNISNNKKQVANAQYDPTKHKMTVSASAENELQASVHELTHAAFAYNTEKMKPVKKAVIDYFLSQNSESEFEEILHQYGASYEGDSRADIEEEFVADALGGMFTTEEGVQDFLDWLQNESGYNANEKKTILQRITEWLNDIIEAIRDIMNGGELNGAGKLFAKENCDELTKIRKMFLEALDGAGENYREGGAVEGDVRNSIKVTQHMEYAEQIDKLFNKTLSRSDSLYIGIPSSKLQQVGFSNNPFAMNQADLRKSNEKTAKNKKYSRHGVSRKFFKLMPEHLNEAVIFIENENGITIVTEYPMLDTKEQLSYVAAGVKPDTAMEDDVVNLIKSVYPLDDFKTRIMRIAENGKLIITDKEKAQTILATVGVQPSEVSRLFELLRDSLSQKGINVKKNSIETDSKGRKLTREQSEFFKDSKIRVREVDGWKNTITPDGELFPVYHGTNSDEFFEFDKRTIGSANDIGWYGKGFYFAFDEREARFYGRRTMECYLNVKKPFFFSEEMQSFKGQSSGDVNFDFASFIINLSEKFPEIAKQTFVQVAEFNSDEVTDKSFTEFAEEIKEIYDSNRFKLSEVDDRGTTTYQYIYSRDIDNIEASENIKRLIREKFIDSSWSAEYYKDKGAITESEFNEILGLFEKYGESRFRDVWIPGRFTDAEYAKKNRLSSVITYLANKKYSYINQHMPEYYMENYIGDDLSQELRKRGYDGILQSKFGDEIVVFDSNQIKLTDNKSPTDNSDIRYSLPLSNLNDLHASNIEKVTELSRVAAQLTAHINYIGSSQTKRTLSTLNIQAVARELKKEYQSKADIHELTPLLEELYKLFEQGRVSSDVVKAHVDSITEKIINESVYMKPDISDYAKDILHELRSVKIKLSDVQKQQAAYHFGSYNEFRKALMGSVVLSEEGTPLDERWQSLCGMFPGRFDSETVDTDQPYVLFETIKELRNTYDDESGLDIDSVKAQLSADICAGYISIPTVAQYSNQYSVLERELLQSLKAEKQMYKQIYYESYNRAKARYEGQLANVKADQAEEILRAKARMNQRVENIADTRLREKKRNRLIKTVKRLDRLLRRPDRAAPSAGTNKYGQEYLHLTNIPEDFKKAVIDFCYIFIENDAGVFTGKYKDSEGVVRKKVFELLKQYGALKESKTYIGTAVNDDIKEKIEKAHEIVADKRLAQLTATELDTLNEIADHLITVINNEVEMWVNGKKTKVNDIGKAALAEQNAKGMKGYIQAMKGIDKINVMNLKPIYFFEKVGGTLEKLWDDILGGQDRYVRNMQYAQQKFSSIAKKHNLDSWIDDDAKTFKTEQGHEIRLTRGQALLVWATWKREGIAGKDSKHLFEGGIVFPDAVERASDKGKNKLPKVLQKVYEDNTAHRIRIEDMMKIDEWLTKEQKAYADELVGFLSNDVASWGNEISMQLYGINKFNEKYYIPFNSAGDYLYKGMGDEGTKLLKSEGFTKETQWGANNPLVVDDFTQVVVKHIERMSMYNSMVIPLDNFSRVWNYQERADADSNDSTQNVKAAFRKAWGNEYKKYVDNLLRDINGGVMTDSREIGDKWISKFKKAAVMGSASVMIQQPSAIVRAFSEVDTKYFVASTFAQRKKAYEEAKKYAPVAVLKEIGGFDTVGGQSMTDWMLKRDYKGKDKLIAFFKDSQFRDDVISWGPAFADRITWAHIWLACKKEAQHTKGLTGEALLEATGKRFTEVINKTQVYDSVLSRSDAMRSKSALMKMQTAFMAEPTTQWNMYGSALRDLRTHGARAKGARKIASVVASQAFNALLVSIIYAARDDDEEKTQWEKYLGEVVGNFLDSLNPLSLVPFVKDIISLMQGYDVERSDMSVFSNVIDALKDLGNDNMSGFEKTLGLAGAGFDVFGFPAKNLIRDGRAFVNTARSLSSGQQTTAGGILAAIRDETLSIPKNFGIVGDKKGEQLYNAFANENASLYAEYASRYKDGKAVKNALTAQIKDRYLKGGITEEKAEEQLLRLGYSENEVYYKLREWVTPADAEEDTASEDEDAAYLTLDGMKSISTEDKEESVSYTFLHDAISKGDTALIKNEIADLLSRGAEEESIKRSVMSKWGKAYRESMNSAERKKIEQNIAATGLWRTGEVFQMTRRWRQQAEEDGRK